MFILYFLIYLLFFDIVRFTSTILPWCNKTRLLRSIFIFLFFRNGGLIFRGLYLLANIFCNNYRSFVWDSTFLSSKCFIAFELPIFHALRNNYLLRRFLIPLRAIKASLRVRSSKLRINFMHISIHTCWLSILWLNNLLMFWMLWCSK